MNKKHLFSKRFVQVNFSSVLANTVLNTRHYIRLIQISEHRDGHGVTFTVQGWSEDLKVGEHHLPARERIARGEVVPCFTVNYLTYLETPLVAMETL